jgi:hypothetical protein
MPADISPYLADQIASHRETALRLLATQPMPQHQAAITQVLRELDILPATVAESYLLQALGHPASQLRAIERAMETPRLGHGTAA